jgi:hypothetical protein
MKSGKFAPNKSAGMCQEHKAYHVPINPSVSKGEGGHDVPIHDMNSYSKGGRTTGSTKNPS